MPIKIVPLAKFEVYLPLNNDQSADVNKPRALAAAFGILNECTVPDELTEKSVPVVLVVNVCVAPLKPLSEVIAAVGVVQLKLPDPSVVITWLAEPEVNGNLKVKSDDNEDEACNAT